jgi:hypothetical protein
MLEHEAGAEFSSGGGQDEPSVKDLREGAALNALSGLQVEVQLISGEAGGWLFENVFGKHPQLVLSDAIAALVQEVGDERCAQLSDLTAEQANLALRRLAMEARYKSGLSLFGKNAVANQDTKDADEFMRVQVWMELIRLHMDGCFTSATASNAVASKTDKDKAQAKDRVERTLWSDCAVLRELGKKEDELEAESHHMGLDALRSQNRAIEEYIMRLVRRRDELRHITKLAEDRDSYLILGLEGPDATEQEIKQAYRNLARKEHPDKAGIGNKRRFQAIQQAYTAVIRHRKEGGACHGAADTPGNNEHTNSIGAVLGPSVSEAAEFARQCKEAADFVASAAHQAFRSAEDGAETQAPAKRRHALRTLRDLTRGGVSDLQAAAKQVDRLGNALCGLARCVEAVLNEHSEAASSSVAGIGLRDRATMVEDAGRSACSTVELLTKMSEATDATLRKVDRAASASNTADAVSAAEASVAGGAYAATLRGGRADEGANLLRLGARLLSESLARTAAVSRRSADDAICSATKAIELAKGLGALDIELRKEQERKQAKQRGYDEDETVAAGDVDRSEPRASTEGSGGSTEKEAETRVPSKTPREGRAAPHVAQASPRDQLKYAQKRVKDRHVSLRVKNLRFLSSLNEETLKMQARLKLMLERSSGALLPAVSVPQKGRIFDLVGQLLDHAAAECARLLFAANGATTPPLRILERALTFALALDHGSVIAMPADSRTQALKLAALIDVDLLSQILDGPFKRRLVALGARRRASESTAIGRRQIPYGLGGNIQAWDDAVHACCERVTQGLRNFSFLTQQAAGACGSNPEPARGL